MPSCAVKGTAPRNHQTTRAGGHAWWRGRAPYRTIGSCDLLRRLNIAETTTLRCGYPLVRV
eukprot:63152-Alexandrium_andersonii.AAC.1